MAVGSSNDFDLVVLGAGTGGYTAAFRAAWLGLKVAFRRGQDRRDVPAPWLHPDQGAAGVGRLHGRVRNAKELGLVLAGEPEVDYAAMAARRDAVVKRLWTGLKSLITKNKVT